MRHSITGEGQKLEQLIKKAIEDLEITPSEYEAIITQANEDGQIDADEERLLHELHQMIAEGIVKRVRG
jgi:hypothetical protein